MKKIIVWVCTSILLLICLLGVILMVDLFFANEGDISDKSVFRLINAYFDIDLEDKATVVYKKYGTNIREEFFTFIIHCTDQDLIETYIQVADTYIPASEIIDDNIFKSQIPQGIDGFYCLYQWNQSGRWTYRILVANDKKTLIYEYDP